MSKQPLLLPFLLLAVAAADGGQLPPDILMDQLLLRVERLVDAEDPDGALEASA